MTEHDGSVFDGVFELRLQKPPYGDPSGDWPMYVSTQKVADTADRRVLSGIYIHRSWLPAPPPEKMRVRFEQVK